VLGSVSVNRPGGKCGGISRRAPQVTCPTVALQHIHGKQTVGVVWSIVYTSTDPSYTPTDTSAATKNRFRRVVIVVVAKSANASHDNGTSAGVKLHVTSCNRNRRMCSRAIRQRRVHYYNSKWWYSTYQYVLMVALSSQAISFIQVSWVAGHTRLQ
jgi:hypothetical protein